MHPWGWGCYVKIFEAEILDLQLEKYGLSFIKKYNTSGWALGDQNGIRIRSFEISPKCNVEHGVDLS